MVVQRYAYVDHRQEILIPSRSSQLPQASLEALKTSAQFSSYVVFDITGKTISTFGKTKSGNLRKFPSEEAMNAARSQKKRRFIVKNGENTQFFVSRKKKPHEVSTFQDMFKTALDWTAIVKAGVLGYLASGLVPGAAATNYIPSDPFAVSTQVVGSLGGCSILDVADTSVAYAWEDDAQIQHRGMDLAEQPIIPQAALSSLPNTNWVPKTVPHGNGYLIFWNEYDGLGVRTAYQKFDANHQALSGKKTLVTPNPSDRFYEVSPTLLPDGRIVVLTLDLSSTPIWKSFQSILTADTADPIGVPQIITTSGNVHRQPSAFATDTGWIDLISIDGTIYRQKYLSSGSKSGSLTGISTTTYDTINQIQSPKGIRFPGGGYLCVWGKVDLNTNRVLGYYFRRFNDSDIPIDSVDQIFIEGDLGIWNFGNMHLTSTPLGGIELFLQTNGTIQRQSFDASGNVEGSLEPFGGDSAVAICAASTPNGVATSWTNATGMFSQFWQAIAPSTTTFTTTILAPASSPTTCTTSTTSSTTSVDTTSTSQTTCTTGAATTSSNVRSSSSSSSVVPIPSSSSNPVNPSKSIREKSQNVGLVIGVSLVACISVAACVAIIGLLILRRRKGEDDSGVELATRVAKPKKKPKVEVYGSLDEAGISNGNGTGVPEDSDDDDEEPDYQDLSQFKVYQDGHPVS